MITKKGLDTRGKIIEKSAQLFNTKGYAGTSISDILKATSYSKGALYRTFPDKKNLAVEAFNLNLKKLQSAFRSFMDSKVNAKDKLLSIPDFYSINQVDDLVEGGCPILNTSIESDDMDKELNSLVRAAFNDWKATIEKLINDGKEQGYFKSEASSQTISHFLIASIEGSILLSKAYKDHGIVERNMEVLKSYLRTTLEIE